MCLLSGGLWMWIQLILTAGKKKKKRLLLECRWKKHFFLFLFLPSLPVVPPLNQNIVVRRCFLQHRSVFTIITSRAAFASFPRAVYFCFMLRTSHTLLTTSFQCKLNTNPFLLAGLLKKKKIFARLFFRAAVSGVLGNFPPLGRFFPQQRRAIRHSEGAHLNRQRDGKKDGTGRCFQSAAVTLNLRLMRSAPRRHSQLDSVSGVQ